MILTHTLLRRLRHALWLPFYLILFLLLERVSFFTPHQVQLAIDYWIPFREEFVIFYCLWYPLLVVTGLYLLARDEAAYTRYMHFLALTFFISEAIWIFFPSVQTLRPAVMPRQNVFTAVIAGIQQIDPPNNVFPSVHVVGSIGAMLAVWDSSLGRRRADLRCGVTVLAALICLSTVMIKQHAVVDVLGGFLLSVIVWLIVYAPETGHAFRRFRAV